MGDMSDSIVREYGDVFSAPPKRNMFRGYRFSVGELVMYPRGQCTYYFIGFDTHGNQVIVATHENKARYVTKKQLIPVKASRRF